MAVLLTPWVWPRPRVERVWAAPHAPWFWPHLCLEGTVQPGMWAQQAVLTCGRWVVRRVARTASTGPDGWTMPGVRVIWTAGGAQVRSPTGYVPALTPVTFTRRDLASLVGCW